MPQMLHGAGIFTYIWAILVVNVGKYSSTMEHLGAALHHQLLPLLRTVATVRQRGSVVGLVEEHVCPQGGLTSCHLGLVVHQNVASGETPAMNRAAWDAFWPPGNRME